MKKFVLPRLVLLGSAAAFTISACSSEGPISRVQAPLEMAADLVAFGTTADLTPGFMKVCVNSAETGPFTVTVTDPAGVITGDAPYPLVDGSAVTVASNSCEVVLIKGTGGGITAATGGTVSFPSANATLTASSATAGTFVFSCVADATKPEHCPSPVSGVNGARAGVSNGHGSVVTFTFTGLTVGNPVISTPLFVIGDQQPHVAGVGAAGNLVNFWGAQWWKNNPTSGLDDKGVASFKGYATDADIVCGGQWTSRVGNSPPPPATIGTSITIIVTDAVKKVGPDIGGVIRKIITVDTQPGYSPNPGHAGNGRVTEVNCS